MEYPEQARSRIGRYAALELHIYCQRNRHHTEARKTALLRYSIGEDIKSLTGRSPFIIQRPGVLFDLNWLLRDFELGSPPIACELIYSAARTGTHADRSQCPIFGTYGCW